MKGSHKTQTCMPLKPVTIRDCGGVVQFYVGTRGVFLAEPISNVIGGSLCFITMLAIVMPELKRMKENEGEKL